MWTPLALALLAGSLIPAQANGNNRWEPAEAGEGQCSLDVEEGTQIDCPVVDGKVFAVSNNPHYVAIRAGEDGTRVVFAESDPAVVEIDIGDDEPETIEITVELNYPYQFYRPEHTLHLVYEDEQEPTDDDIPVIEFRDILRQNTEIELELERANPAFKITYTRQQQHTGGPTDVLVYADEVEEFTRVDDWRREVVITLNERAIALIDDDEFTVIDPQNGEERTYNKEVGETWINFLIDGHKETGWIKIKIVFTGEPVDTITTFSVEDALWTVVEVTVSKETRTISADVGDVSVRYIGINKEYQRPNQGFEWELVGEDADEYPTYYPGVVGVQYPRFKSPTPIPFVLKVTWED